MEVRRRLLKHHRFEAAFGTDFEVLGAQFSLIFESPETVFLMPRRIYSNMRAAFQVAELTLMIRATRGRSRRPNHMRSPVDALQTPTPVDFR